MLEHTYSDDLSRPITDKNSGATRPRLLTDLSHIDVINSHYSGDTGYGVERGTAWGLFQAITQYETHDRGRNRGMSRSVTDKARTRLEALYGGASVRASTEPAAPCWLSSDLLAGGVSHTPQTRPPQ